MVAKIPFQLTFEFSRHAGDLEQLTESIKSSRYGRMGTMLTFEECYFGVLSFEITSQKKEKASEKAQQLKVLAAFEEDQNSVPSTYIRQLNNQLL
ncbi:hypothetical protein STEG23_006741 [Scotinomys teguina]